MADPRDDMLTDPEQFTNLAAATEHFQNIGVQVLETRTVLVDGNRK